MFRFCDYCYAKQISQEIKEDMTPQNFQNILQWFKGVYGIDKIALLGGEPTEHGELDKIVDVLSKFDIKAMLFTNGVFREGKRDILEESSNISTIIFHYEDNFISHEKLGRRFRENLAKLNSSGKEINFRFNATKIDFEYENVVDLAKKYGALILFSITSPDVNYTNCYVPLEEMNNYADRIVEFVKFSKESGVKVVNKRPLPYCSFNDGQLEYLKSQGAIKGECCLGSIAINPDLSLMPAPSLTNILTSPVSNQEDLISEVNRLKENVEHIKWQPSMEKCIPCEFYQNKECQGGCTVYKLSNRKF